MLEKNVAEWEENHPEKEDDRRCCKMMKSMQESYSYSEYSSWDFHSYYRPAG